MVPGLGRRPISFGCISFTGVVQGYHHIYKSRVVLSEEFNKSSGDIPDPLVRSEEFWSKMQNRHPSSWNSTSAPALAITHQLDQWVPACTVLAASLA